MVWSKRAARQASSFTHAPGKASSSRGPWVSVQTLWARAHAGPACLAAGDLPGRLASVTAPRGLPLLRSMSCSRGAPSTRLTVKGPLSFPLCRQAGLPCMQPPPVCAASSRACSLLPCAVPRGPSLSPPHQSCGFTAYTAPSEMAQPHSNVELWGRFRGTLTLNPSSGGPPGA